MGSLAGAAPLTCLVAASSLPAELLRGRMTREDYRAKAEALWDALVQDTRVATVLERADKDRALLVS